MIRSLPAISAPKSKLLLSLVAMAALAFVSPVTTASAADIEKGAKVVKKCVSCHMVGDKAKNLVGPQLNGIVGREIASIEGYKYSKGMIAYAETQGIWSAEALDTYLLSPRKAVKGTRMGFAGLRKEKDRVNVIAYLAEQK